MALVIIGGIIAAMYFFSAAMTHVKVIRLSASEAILVSMVVGLFMMTAAFVISQEILFAVVTMAALVLFTVLLFVRKANRWFLMREMEKANSRSIQKERLDRGGP